MGIIADLAQKEVRTPPPAPRNFKEWLHAGFGEVRPISHVPHVPHPKFPSFPHVTPHFPAFPTCHAPFFPSCTTGIRLLQALTESFMKPYNAKVWAHPAEEMNSIWVGERVATIKFDSILSNVIQKKVQIPNNPFSPYVATPFLPYVQN